MADVMSGGPSADRRAAIAAAATSPALTFAQFYESTRDQVYRTVLVATRHPQRAEDAVHEAYARALSAWDRVAVHPNPAAWVARVALNQATSWWRVRRREVSAPPDRGAVVDEAPIDAAIIRIVWSLPLRQRQVVALRLLLDQSTDETARVLGLAPGTVKTHLHRALAELRQALTAAGFEELSNA
jgi:RNA polymerase sigma factor (sigma-70 family)